MERELFDVTILSYLFHRVVNYRFSANSNKLCRLFRLDKTFIEYETIQKSLRDKIKISQRLSRLI